MLDRLKCLQELQSHVPRFCTEATQELQKARELFSWLMEHPTTLESLKVFDAPYVRSFMEWCF